MLREKATDLWHLIMVRNRERNRERERERERENGKSILKKTEGATRGVL